MDIIRLLQELSVEVSLFSPRLRKQALDLVRSQIELQRYTRHVIRQNAVLPNMFDLLCHKLVELLGFRLWRYLRLRGYLWLVWRFRRRRNTPSRTTLKVIGSMPSLLTFIRQFGLHKLRVVFICFVYRGLRQLLDVRRQLSPIVFPQGTK